MKNNNEAEIQTNETTHSKSEKVLVLISFGVIVYSLIQLFSDNNQTSNTYMGAILLSSIILILSLGIIGITESSRLNSQTTKKSKETMIYKQEEMIEETELAKSLEEQLDRVISNPLNKLIILREDKPDAVMLSIEEYERIRAAADYLEDIQSRKIIQ